MLFICCAFKINTEFMLTVYMHIKKMNAIQQNLTCIE